MTMVEWSECQNCGRVWFNENLNPIEDLKQRVAPGEIMPAGECPDPKCGAVCHLLSERDVEDLKTRALNILGHIGPEDFMTQRMAVLDCIGDKEEDRLMGLDSLLDDIADFLHDSMGMSTVLRSENED